MRVSGGVSMLGSRHARHRLALLVPLAAGLGVAGCFDDSGYELDQESGATSPRAGTPNGSGGKGNSGAGNTSGTAASNNGGSGDIDPDYPEPLIDAMEPAAGPYGTLVTISGQGLGSASRSGFTLL